MVVHGMDADAIVRKALANKRLAPLVHCCPRMISVECRAARRLPSGIWPWIEAHGVGCRGRFMTMAAERIVRMLKTGRSDIITMR
jgi:hypothetical protein